MYLHFQFDCEVLTLNIHIACHIIFPNTYQLNENINRKTHSLIKKTHKLNKGSKKTEVTELEPDNPEKMQCERRSRWVMPITPEHGRMSQ